MVYIMNRYQIYLDPKDIGTLDKLAKLTNFSRSQIIRDVIARMAREYEKILEKYFTKRAQSNPLLKMAGMARGGRKDISRNIDEIYLKD